MNLREKWKALAAWARARLAAVCETARAVCADIALDARGVWAALRDGAKILVGWLRRRGPRLGVPLALANLLLLIVWLCAPHQVPVIIYKLAGVQLAGWNGYWFHRTVMPYAQPSGLLKRSWREAPGFQENKEDFELVEGKEGLFAHLTWQRSAFVLVPMLAVAVAL